jgi:hypothetical protein
MGEKANITSEELAASAGGLSAHVRDVGVVVRDTVVGRTIDGALDRGKSDEAEPDPTAPPQDR